MGAVLLLGACADMPNGPSVMALPGTSKSSDQFRDDELELVACALDRLAKTRVVGDEAVSASTH